jgi:hypothetical protein
MHLMVTPFHPYKKVLFFLAYNSNSTGKNCIFLVSLVRNANVTVYRMTLWMNQGQCDQPSYSETNMRKPTIKSRCV